MREILLIAGKEFRDGLRNRWVLATTLLMAALALTLALLGSAPSGTVGVSPLSVVVVSLSSLTIFLVPLIALLISYDAIAGPLNNLFDFSGRHNLTPLILRADTGEKAHRNADP